MDWRDRARGQAGVISRGQLIGCGLSRARITGAIDRRELVELMPGVYSPRPVPDSARQGLWAAALWSGGVVSHRSAAALWKLPVDPTKLVHVTVDDRRYRYPVAGVRIHRVPLGRLHRVSYDGLPVTDRARTVIELLRTEPFAVARTLLDRALQQEWLSEHHVLHSVGDEPGRTGNGQVRQLVAELEPGAQAESERRLHRLLRSARIDGWVPQYRVELTHGQAYVDIAFPEQRLAIEVEGRRHHDAAADRFESDRTRGNELVAQGWRVLRVTWNALTRHPDQVVSQIRALLAT